MEADLVVALGSISGVLNGKHYNRCIRTHKVMYEALTQLLFKSFLESIPASKREQVFLLIGKFYSHFPLCITAFLFPTLHHSL